MLDNTDFMDTDIPFEIPLPDQPYMPVSKSSFLCLTELDCVLKLGMSLYIFLQEDKREEIKEWVLALSMDRRVRFVPKYHFILITSLLHSFFIGGTDLTIR